MKDENGKVIFDADEQAEIDRVVQERLNRERSKYNDYEDVKAITEELKAFGYEGTPAEIRAAIKQQREEIQKQQELEELQQQANDEGTSPELLAEIKELKKELSTLKGERDAQKEAEEQKKANDEAWNKQVNEFKEVHPEVDLDALADDKKFAKFVKGKNMPLLELYEDFMDFTGESDAEIAARIAIKKERSTGSGKEASSEGSTHGLTLRQQQLAKSNGMTYKEYADYLSNIQ